MNHIKLRGELIENNTKVKITVLSQTIDEGKPFGSLDVEFNPSESECIAKFFKHQQVILYHVASGVMISYDYLKADNRFWLHLPGHTLKQTTCVVDTERWPMIKAAINAYNEWGAQQ